MHATTALQAFVLGPYLNRIWTGITVVLASGGDKFPSKKEWACSLKGVVIVARQHQCCHHVTTSSTHSRSVGTPFEVAGLSSYLRVPRVNRQSLQSTGGGLSKGKCGSFYITAQWTTDHLESSSRQQTVPTKYGGGGLSKEKCGSFYITAQWTTDHLERYSGWKITLTTERAALPAHKISMASRHYQLININKIC